MLPIEAVLPELLTTLQGNPTALLQAPPGAGKTTRVPPALLEADWIEGRRILMLEPRRLAARAAARFMAGEMGESVGRTVGYRTRLDSRVSGDTRIEVVTEGILIRLIQSDPELQDYAIVIFDEFHERSLQADLGLALALDVQRSLRPQLRLLIMSATLETASLADALDDAPVIASAGRSHPVEVHCRPCPRQKRLEAHVAATVRQAIADEPGSVLVFLPGAGEIRRVAERLEAGLPADVRVCPLFGQLDPAAQDAAIAPAPDGQRKIVLATAIAESSLTIEGIRVVVDAGLQRRPGFDPNSGMTRLITERVSRSSAEQRCGRAGRIEPGACYRLWTESEQERLKPHSEPEIAAADLAPLVLELARWGVTDPRDLFWLDRPPPAHWQQAVDLLQWLDALDDKQRITAHGRDMLELGLHPRLAHMMLAGRDRGLGGLAAELAALLSDRDPLPPQSGADISLRLEAMRDTRNRSGRLAQARKLARKLNDRRASDPQDPSAAGGLLMLAWPDRVARARPGQRGKFLLSNGRGAVLPEDDPLAGADWLVACELDGRAREARIFLAAATDRATIEQALSAHIETGDRADWDERRGTVVARRERRLGALVLETSELERPDAAVIEAGLLTAVKRKGLSALPWTDAARQWQARVQLLHDLWPESWPDVDDSALAECLEDWLGPFLAGLRRWPDVERLDLTEALNAMLDRARQQALARLAPKRIEIPGGRRVTLDYTAEGGPVLAIRLQSVFGWRRTPAVADGRIPVVLHLLSPAGRPLAITSDLASFWQNAYPQVRKDMRGRYPKHDWPEDPLAAGRVHRGRVQ